MVDVLKIASEKLFEKSFKDPKLEPLERWELMLMGKPGTVKGKETEN